MSIFQTSFDVRFVLKVAEGLVQLEYPYRIAL